MPINILLVEEDLTTQIKDLGAIEINDNFYELRNIAREQQCTLIATIDDTGNTIINQLQIEVLRKEVQHLRKHTQANQHLLDLLDSAAHATSNTSCEYIKFMGD